MKEVTYEGVESEQEEEKTESYEHRYECDTLVHADLHDFTEAELLSMHPVR